MFQGKELGGWDMGWGRLFTEQHFVLLILELLKYIIDFLKVK